MMRETRVQWGRHRTSAARCPRDERGCGMHFLSQYSSFTSQLFDGHPPQYGFAWIFPGTSWSCDCRTSLFSYPLFAMTCTLQNSLSPSSLNSIPIPEFL